MGEITKKEEKITKKGNILAFAGMWSHWTDEDAAEFEESLRRGWSSWNREYIDKLFRIKESPEPKSGYNKVVSTDTINLS